jgi:hypothetical protein
MMFAMNSHEICRREDIIPYQETRCRIEFSDPSISCAGWPAIWLPKVAEWERSAVLILLHRAGRGVSRTIVNDDDFKVLARLFLEVLKANQKSVYTIVGWDNYANRVDGSLPNSKPPRILMRSSS